MNAQEWFESALERYTKAVGDESTRQVREKVIESIRFARVPGAQWEGSTFAGTDIAENTDKYPRFELNKVAREVDRIISEYRRNKITVKYRPSDEYASVELAEKLNKAFRADWIRSNGDFAAINAFDDAVTGGMGAFEVCAEYADDEDPENDRMQIMFKPVYDTQSCLFWDGAAKSYDKSDAMWCGMAYTMTPDDFKSEYKDAAPESVQKIETGQWNDWVTPDAVTLCKWFEVKIEKVEAITFLNPVTGEKAVYIEDEIEEVIDELNESGFFEVDRRKLKKRRVYCGVFSDDGWLEKPKRIAGSYIPICMQYGKRYFIDNQERIEGHVTKAMDAQRLDNLMTSMLADAATLGTENTPIVDVEQVQGLENFWGMRNKKRLAYLPLRSVKDKAGNIIQPAAIAGYTQPAQVSPALATLLTYAGQNIQQIVGGENMQQLPSNLAEDTVAAIFGRADMQSYIYMDNAAMTMKYCGKVWLSMARELYADVSVAMEDEEGNRSFGALEGSIKDRQSGETVKLNDISAGKFDVDVDVGESFASRRDANRKELLTLLPMMPPDSPYVPVIMSMIVANTDGEGVEELQRFNKKLMIKNGIAKPEEEDAELVAELQAEMEQQQPPVDPNVLLAQAEMQKAAVAEQKNQMEYQKFLMEYELRRAELQLEAVKVGADVKLKDAQSFKYNQEATNGIRESVQSTLQIR